MKFSLTQFLLSISVALDFIEIDLLNDVTLHNKRVAYISNEIGKAIGLNEEQLFDLAACSLLHDSGAASSEYKVKASIHAFEGAKEHCIQGQKIVEMLPLGDISDVILYHHEKVDGSGFFGLIGKDIPLYSKIIYLADAAELRFRLQSSKDEVMEFVASHSGVWFDKDLCDAFFKIAEAPAFGLDLKPIFIADALNIPFRTSETSWSEIRNITPVLSNIIDMKSAFTANHSSGLAKKAEKMARYYNFDDDKLNKFVIAADLHDLGKLAVPNAILDKPGALNKDEIKIIQTHTYYTRRALEKIQNFEDITEWASNHHEKIGGNGYPYRINELSFESKLMGVLDIYQALTEDRPYRSGMTHAKAVEIIDRMAVQGELDRAISNDVDSYFKNF